MILYVNKPRQSICRFCLPLLIHTLSSIMDLLMTHNYRCLLLTKCPSYVTLCCHIYVILTLGQLQTCLSLVTQDKTHACHLARNKYLHNLPTLVIIENAQIPSKQSVKNLSFTFACHLTTNEHVYTAAWTCNSNLRRLTSIRRYLTNAAPASLVSASFCIKN